MADDHMTVKASAAALPSIGVRTKTGGAKAALKDLPPAVSTLVADARNLASVGEYQGALRLFEEALAHDPSSGVVLRYYAQVADQMAQALAERAAAAAGKRPPAATSLDHRISVAATRMADGDRPDPSRPPPWPNRPVLWRDTDKVFRRMILAETTPEPGLISASSRVVTMGSCFARNVGAELQTHGVLVYYQLLKEDLNSTFANERLVRWAIEGPSSVDGDVLEAAFGPEAREAMRRELTACSTYIFSLGVAPVLKDAEGRFVMRAGSIKEMSDEAGARIETTGPKENADNVRSIIHLLRSINPTVQVFLTLSPTPLAASLERKSAIVADCLSKSSLRLAVEDVMADRMEGVRYWPSFEMAKWWGPHLQEGRAFGADDQQSRHVSAWLVGKIVDLFVEYYGDASLTRRA